MKERLSNWWTLREVRAAAANVWPDSTSRTASCLNSSVFLPRFPFLIFVSVSRLKQLAKVLRGKVILAKLDPWLSLRIRADRTRIWS